MKKTLLAIVIFLLSILLFGCANKAQQEEKGQRKAVPHQTVRSDQEAVVYKNTQYGFSFLLPKSWKGYSIITDKWEGLAIEGSQGEKTVETGPIIYIRHPKWTSKEPRQDIPVMIFTLEQWKQLQQEKFHIGAAPIGPSELGRNARYVFALPARYNFAFQTGYKEVEDILKSNPLKAD